MHEPKVAEKDTPYWWEASPLKPLPQQPLPKKLDVLIVGAGYAGLSAGLVLAREGRSVAAFDAMNPGEGASTRNGGITSASIRPDYATISRRFGEDKALAIEVEGKIAREFLYEFIKTERLECDFQLVGQFKCAFGYEQYETMARSADALCEEIADRVSRGSVCRAAQLHRHRHLPWWHGPDGYRWATPGEVSR